MVGTLFWQFKVNTKHSMSALLKMYILRKRKQSLGSKQYVVVLFFDYVMFCDQ